MPRGRPIREELTDKQFEAIQFLILNRFNPTSTYAQCADTIGVKRKTLLQWRKRQHFTEEYQRQLALYRTSFDDIQLADRREGVQALQSLFHKLDKIDTTKTEVDMKLKVLREIRVEVGDEHPLRVDHLHGGNVDHAHALAESQEVRQQGPNIPPRATTLDQWLEENEKQLPANGSPVEALTVEAITPNGEPEKGESHATSGQ